MSASEVSEKVTRQRKSSKRDGNPVQQEAPTWSDASSDAKGNNLSSSPRRHRTNNSGERPKQKNYRPDPSPSVKGENKPRVHLRATIGRSICPRERMIIL